MTSFFVRIQNEIQDRDERGAAMAEYGLLLALVALVAIGVLATFGGKIADVFTESNTSLDKGLTAAKAGGTTATTATTAATATTN